MTNSTTLSGCDTNSMIQIGTLSYLENEQKTRLPGPLRNYINNLSQHLENSGRIEFVEAVDASHIINAPQSYTDWDREKPALISLELLKCVELPAGFAGMELGGQLRNFVPVETTRALNNIKVSDLNQTPYEVHAPVSHAKQKKRFEEVRRQLLRARQSFSMRSNETYEDSLDPDIFYAFHNYGHAVTKESIGRAQRELKVIKRNYRRLRRRLNQARSFYLQQNEVSKS